MTDGPDKGAGGSPPAGQQGKRRVAFWTDKAPRGLALAALTLIGGGVAVLALNGPQPATPRFQAIDATSFAPQATDDPLMPELIRCRALPPQATDPACDRVWDENRRRFFGETQAARVPGDPQQHDAPIPAPASMPPATPPPPSAAKDN